MTYQSDVSSNRVWLNSFSNGEFSVFENYAQSEYNTGAWVSRIETEHGAEDLVYVRSDQFPDDVNIDHYNASLEKLKEQISKRGPVYARSISDQVAIETYYIDGRLRAIPATTNSTYIERALDQATDPLNSDGVLGFRLSKLNQLAVISVAALQDRFGCFDPSFQDTVRHVIREGIPPLGPTFHSAQQSRDDADLGQWLAYNVPPNGSTAVIRRACLPHTSIYGLYRGLTTSWCTDPNNQDNSIVSGSYDIMVFPSTNQYQIRPQHLIARDWQEAVEELKKVSADGQTRWIRAVETS